MIEPSKVKEAYKRIEEENYAFRVYLKNHADEDELDEQFFALHKELFSNYDCSKCRNCCKEYSASFEEEELGLVAAFLKMTEKEFRDKYIKENYGEYQLNVRPCCFLKEDGGCEIESCKPSSCKDYPYTDKPERLFSLLNIVDSTGVCPVVFEMFERFKQEYRFKPRSWDERIMDIKHLKLVNNFKDGISIEGINDLIENRVKYSVELLEILDYTVSKAEELCKEGSFVLHILAMYALAFFKEKQAYPGIVAISKLPPRIINPLLEDTITEGLSSIIASVFDGNLEPIKEIIESSECDTYVRKAALGSLVALSVNGVIDRNEVVFYFKELFNQRLHLLTEDVIECLIDMSLDIHPKGLEEEINNANDGDVLGFSSPDIDYRLKEQGLKSIECVLEEVKKYSEHCLVSKEDVLSLSKWLGNTSKVEAMYDEDNEEYDPFIHGFDDEDDFTVENTTTVRDIEKIGRNHPCPCGSGKKYKKCCGR